MHDMYDTHYTHYGAINITISPHLHITYDRRLIQTSHSSMCCYRITMSQNRIRNVFIVGLRRHHHRQRMRVRCKLLGLRLSANALWPFSNIYDDLRPLCVCYCEWNASSFNANTRTIYRRTHRLLFTTYNAYLTNCAWGFFCQKNQIR